MGVRVATFAAVVVAALGFNARMTVYPGVAHDFNNLLTPIVGLLDMFQRKGIGGER